MTSGPNNIKYLVPAKTLINPSTLSNLICNDFAAIKVLYEISQIKISPHNFSSNKILSKLKSSILIKIFCFNYVSDIIARFLILTF